MPPDPTLQDLGENEVIRRLTATLHVDPAQVELGAGDDCALLPTPAPASATQLLFKTDALVEGVHFTWEMGPALVGRKAVARVLSDLAAMGGVPQALLVTVGAPGTLPFRQLELAYQGMNALCAELGCSIAGGELTQSPGVTWFSIAALGHVPVGRVGTRSAGQPGDQLYVTGRLGGSLESGRHLTFMPRLAEGQWLLANFRIHAMMDLSDGLGADLPRLAAASGTGYSLEDTALPLHAGCTPAQALHDGEDYELLFAIPPEAAAELAARWATEFPQVPLTRIGQLTDASAPGTNGHGTGGYEHFRQRGGDL